MLRVEPRDRDPYVSGSQVVCSICKMLCRSKDGWFACCKADYDCDYDVCHNCFKGDIFNVRYDRIPIENFIKNVFKGEMIAHISVDPDSLKVPIHECHL